MLRTNQAVASVHEAPAPQTLPVLPLNSVLYPDGLVPLRVFEPRYLDLVAQCMREDDCFVVALITSGSETGEAEFHPVGTSARIVDWDQGPDGILHVQCVGEHRVRIHDHEVRRNGLYVAGVDVIPTPQPVALPIRHRRLSEMIAEHLSEIAVYTKASIRPNDAHWLADRLCEILPLGLTDRQALLELDDPLVRLDLLCHLLPAMTRA
ncbi:MAG: LON peptidase substrate-binding domain-containing protein [Gammaproteobacteria bacterium]